MKFIVDADPEDAPAVLAKMVEEIPAFSRMANRPGWGWSQRINGKNYFLRLTRRGLSACPVEGSDLFDWEHIGDER